MPNTFKAFASKEARDAQTDMDSKQKFRDWEQNKRDLAAAATEFGGRRLLGVTDKGNAIWAQYYIDKETLNIQVLLTHEIETIRKAKLCPRRVTLARGEKLLDTIQKDYLIVEENGNEITIQFDVVEEE